MELLVVIPIILLVIALLLEPMAQRRRERALWEQMKDARNATEAKTVVDCAIESKKQDSKLPEKWYHSYRFWLR
jgi:hypothetical protein